MTDRGRAIQAALIHLTAARDLLKVAGARGATAKARAAITSAQGAIPAPRPALAPRRRSSQAQGLPQPR
jgi:hypothetical protein